MNRATLRFGNRHFRAHSTRGSGRSEGLVKEGGSGAMGEGAEAP
jgi:hypothetical protein